MLVFRLISDIAMRALSAAINDQATAVQCLDITKGRLRHLAVRNLREMIDTGCKSSH